MPGNATPVPEPPVASSSSAKQSSAQSSSLMQSAMQPEESLTDPLSAQQQIVKYFEIPAHVVGTRNQGE